MKFVKPYINSLHKSPTHSLQKKEVSSFILLEGLSVEGDIHTGKTVKHKSRIAKNPNAPNLRQVLLIHYELLEEHSKGIQR